MLNLKILGLRIVIGVWAYYMITLIIYTFTGKPLSPEGYALIPFNFLLQGNWWTWLFLIMIMFLIFEITPKERNARIEIL